MHRIETYDYLIHWLSVNGCPILTQLPPLLRLWGAASHLYPYCLKNSNLQSQLSLKIKIRQHRRQPKVLNFLCSTSLQLSSTRCVLWTISSHCPFSSKQRRCAMLPPESFLTLPIFKWEWASETDPHQVLPIQTLTVPRGPHSWLEALELCPVSAVGPRATENASRSRML